MALHEQSVGSSDEWYTPAHVFEAMAVRFDLDPCSAPGAPSRLWCDRNTRQGLDGSWRGSVWLNPPFGGRNGLVPWLSAFMAHGDGVCLVPDRTSAPWWQTYAPRADLALFVSPKIKFLGPDRLPGRSPAQGTTLLAKGEIGQLALRNAVRAGLGSLWIPA